MVPLGARSRRLLPGGDPGPLRVPSRWRARSVPHPWPVSLRGANEQHTWGHFWGFLQSAHSKTCGPAPFLGRPEGQRRGTDAGAIHILWLWLLCVSPLRLHPLPQGRAEVWEGPAWEACCRASLPCSHGAPANFPLIWRACCRGSVGEEVTGLTPISSSRAAWLASGALQSGARSL